MRVHQCAFVCKYDCLYCCVCACLCVPSASILHFVQIITECMGPNTTIHTGIKALGTARFENRGMEGKEKEREEEGAEPEEMEYEDKSEFLAVLH